MVLEVVCGLKYLAYTTRLADYPSSYSQGFRKLFLPKYTEEQFLDVSEKVLSKTSPSIAKYIAANVWKKGGDVRDVISIGKLVRKYDGPEQIGPIIKTMTKYGIDGRENDC